MTASIIVYSTFKIHSYLNILITSHCGNFCCACESASLFENVQNLGSKVTNQNTGVLSERSASTRQRWRVFKFCCKTIVRVRQCHWSVNEKSCYPLFSISVLIGYFCSRCPGSSSRTVKWLKETRNHNQCEKKHSVVKKSRKHSLTAIEFLHGQAHYFTRSVQLQFWFSINSFTCR